MQTISIHIGLNQVDPKEYGGWPGKLRACEADAQAMEALAAAQGIAKRILLLTAEATYARVMAELKNIAQTLRSGDYLLLTFAGHGASFKDIPIQTAPSASMPTSEPEAPGELDSGDDEVDGRDEAWCLYDTYLLDDELHDALLKLAPGVRVCAVSDSCFSGTVTRDGEVADGESPVPRPIIVRGDESPTQTERRAPPRLADALYRRHFLTKYLSRNAAVMPSRAKRPGAHIVLLAACQDNQTASEGPTHGLFTEKLLEVWSTGQRRASHREFVTAINDLMPMRQKPNLFISGAPNPCFESTPPFTP